MSLGTIRTPFEHFQSFAGGSFDVSSTGEEGGPVIEKPHLIGGVMMFTISASGPGVGDASFKVQGRIGDGDWEDLKDHDGVVIEVTPEEGKVDTYTVPIKRLSYDDYRASVTGGGGSGSISVSAGIYELRDGRIRNHRERAFFRLTPFDAPNG